MAQNRITVNGKVYGRPKHGDQFRTELWLMLQETDGDATKLRRVAQALYREAIRGNVAAIREIADRIDGKVPQAVMNPDGSPVQVSQNIVDMSYLTREERLVVRDLLVKRLEAEAPAALTIEG